MCIRDRLDDLAGRLTELSGVGAVASLTAATALVLEAQLRGEPCAWIVLPGSSFFPPDLAASGAVRGATDGATLTWKRVPYAAPPIGDLRLRAPLPAPCAADELDATALGPTCPQLTADGAFAGSEDCLHLNLWAPASAPAARWSPSSRIGTSVPVGWRCGSLPLRGAFGR